MAEFKVRITRHFHSQEYAIVTVNAEDAAGALVKADRLNQGSAPEFKEDADAYDCFDAEFEVIDD